MIEKREILDLATQTSLTPHVIEKDYVLGWMLAGIYSHEELAESWIFKGGTCLKKCFFETYRFSEDLDFTLRDEAQLNEAYLKRVFAEVGAWVYEETGIEIPVDQLEFDIYRNPRGNLSCQGKISYKGPVSPTRPLPRIKLDLTADERIVLPPETVEIFHPYSDAPEEGIEVLAYDYVEAFAEKFRALAERTRPRDLYDVVNLYRNADARPEQQQFVAVLREKCAFKGIQLPQLADIEPHRGDVEAGWSGMLNNSASIRRLRRPGPAKSLRRQLRLLFRRVPHLRKRLPTPRHLLTKPSLRTGRIESCSSFMLPSIGGPRRPTGCRVRRHPLSSKRERSSLQLSSQGFALTSPVKLPRK